MFDLRMKVVFFFINGAGLIARPSAGLPDSLCDRGPAGWTLWVRLNLPSAGLEPATYSLGNCRSVLMSYEGDFSVWGD